MRLGKGARDDGGRNNNIFVMLSLNAVFNS